MAVTGAGTAGPSRTKIGHPMTAHLSSTAPRLKIVTVAGTEIDVAEAITIITGYCLGQEELTWIAPSSGVGPQPAARRRGAFAYSTYDCIRPGVSDGLEPVDVLVADGLNAQMRAKDIAGILAVAGELAVEISRIDAKQTVFWNLTPDDVTKRPTSEASEAWPLWRAWTILMGVDGVDVARTHKILHHKRPTVFPLLDNMTIKLLPSDSAWGAIHHDLAGESAAWADLETTVGDLLESNGRVRLTRLRLHDILLWTTATGKQIKAKELGQRFLQGPPAASDPRM